MPAEKLARTTWSIRLKPSEMKGIFRASERLLDLMEDMLERSGAYQPEFLKGLQTSLKQAKSKKLLTISSLKSL